MGSVVMWVGQPVSQPARLSFFGCESESASEAQRLEDRRSVIRSFSFVFARSSFVTVVKGVEGRGQPRVRKNAKGPEQTDSEKGRGNKATEKGR